MFVSRNKKDIGIFRMKKVAYLLLCNELQPGNCPSYQGSSATFVGFFFFFHQFSIIWQKVTGQRGAVPLL